MFTIPRIMFAILVSYASWVACTQPDACQELHTNDVLPGNGSSTCQPNTVESSFGFPSLTKCIGSTIAGSLFSVLGVLIESSRDKRRRQQQALKEKSASAGAQVSSRRPERSASEVPPLAMESHLPPIKKLDASSVQISSIMAKKAMAGVDWDTVSAGIRAREHGVPFVLGAARSNWAANMPGRGKTAMSVTERTERQVKSILNKLTWERFQTLYAQFWGCCVQEHLDDKVVDIVAREVFAKATAEHGFVDLYANLCAELQRDFEEAGVRVNFKRALIEQCRVCFNRSLNRTAEEEASEEELLRRKTTMLGNAKFLGHLLRFKLAHPRIIFDCTEQLLGVASPVALEILCVFLASCAKTFDTPQWRGHSMLQQVFVRIEELAEDERQPRRVRCLLQNLLDEKRGGWQH